MKILKTVYNSLAQIYKNKKCEGKVKMAQTENFVRCYIIKRKIDFSTSLEMTNYVISIENSELKMNK
jgi:hypothetical protein